MDGVDDADSTFFCFHRHCATNYDSLGNYRPPSSSRRSFEICNNPGRQIFYQPARISLYLSVLAGSIWSPTVGRISVLPGVRYLRVSLGLKKSAGE